MFKKITNVVEVTSPVWSNSVSRAVVYTVLCTPLQYPVCIVFRTTESCMSIIDTYHHCIKMNWPSHLELVVEVYSSRIYVTNLYMILRDIISLKQWVPSDVNPARTSDSTSFELHYCYLLDVIGNDQNNSSSLAKEKGILENTYRGQHPTSWTQHSWRG